MDDEMNNTGFALQYRRFNLVGLSFPDGSSIPGPEVNEDASTDAPLLVAARKVQKKTVESLIASGADIKCVSERGWTVLHYAAKNGWLSIVQYLVDKGAEIDVKLPPPDLRTPLLLAAAGNHNNVVTFLIKSGADITWRDELSHTALYYACSKGMLDVVQLISEKGYDLESAPLSGKWPLLVAAENHRREIVRFLIESGANVNITDGDGRTLLHYVARNGWPDVVRLLVERVENCDAIEYVDFENPLHFACRFDMIKLAFIRMRIGEEYEWNQFLKKAVSDVVEIIKILTEKGISINSVNFMSETPAHLSFTCLKNKGVDNTLLLRVLNCLFKAGADCNLRDFCGRSLFKFFISSDNIDFVRLGIENGGYFEGFDISMDKHPNIMEHILTDVSYCTRAIVNKYNIKDLPAVYETFDIGDTFPSIKIMEIGRDSGIVREIENAVICDIEARGYCNILQISPLSLSLLIVKSILKQ